MWTEWADYFSHLLPLAGRLLLTGEVAEHVLDLGHVGHDVLDQDQRRRVVQLTLALLPQDLLVTTEHKKALRHNKYLSNLK